MSLFAELKRRNVFRVGIAYAVGSWLLVQAADLVLDVIGAESWVLQSGRLVDRVFEIIDLLAEGGLDGPLTTLRSGVEVRSWPVQPLRIYYRREADELIILRIYHQSRRPL